MSAIRPASCAACRAKVTWAKFPDGVVRPIEACPDGEGTVALQPMLPGLGGRTEARIVSGVRTSYRMHLDTCPKAHVYRDRWRVELRCATCAVPMVALERGRSMCSKCQAAERVRLEQLAEEMRARLGADEARALIVCALTRPSRGKR